MAYYGILRANAVVVPVNPMNRAEEFKHFITDPQTRVVICTADLAPIVAKANAEVPEAERLSQVLVTRYTDTMPAGEIDPADAPLPRWTPGSGATLACPRATSAGTTCWPSVACPERSPRSPTTSPCCPTPRAPPACPRAACTRIAPSCPTRSAGGPGATRVRRTVTLAVVPMFHITGMMYGLLGNIYTGSTSVLLPRWDRELAGRLISKYKITHWTCIPTMIIDLFGSPTTKTSTSTA